MLVALPTGIRGPLEQNAFVLRVMHWNTRFLDCLTLKMEDIMLLQLVDV
jgi:hypothetical protein